MSQTTSTPTSAAAKVGTGFITLYALSCMGLWLTRTRRRGPREKKGARLVYEIRLQSSRCAPSGT